MKINKFFNIAAGIALTLSATSCSSDYLDLHPEGTIPYEEVLTNSQGATLAVFGLCNSMYKQYSALYDYNWFNGEPWLSMYYGEVMGQDYISLFWFDSFPTLVNWSMMNEQSQGAQVAWAYCYNLISQANNIITFAPKQLDAEGKVVENENGNPVPDFSGDEDPATYAFRYAQALTMRAHAYLRLMQIYAPRWADRYIYGKNGNEVLTVPLRLEYQSPEGNLDCPLAYMSDVMWQIYYDLDQAIELYDQSGMKRSHMWEPDKQIAQGIYARAALLREDWKTARAMAHEARVGYPLMTADEYQQGFAVANGEWMWYDSGEAVGVYYASFGATYACNGAYPCRWGTIGAGAIDNELMKISDPSDLRTTLFFSPENYGGTTKALFWGDQVNKTTLDINGKFLDLHKLFVTFCQSKAKAVDNSWAKPYTPTGWPIGEDYTICTAQFGAQFKFWGTDTYSSSQFPFMRGAEMLLIEAEAAFNDPENPDEATAMALLNELNAQRMRNYRNKNYTGETLIRNIKIGRRIELWGEGFNWFDFKRWKEPIVRKEWINGRPDSGNWPASVAHPVQGGDFDVTLNRGWRWRIPSTEYNYNHAIDQAEANANDDMASDAQ